MKRRAIPCHTSANLRQPRGAVHQRAAAVRGPQQLPGLPSVRAFCKDICGGSLRSAAAGAMAEVAAAAAAAAT